MVVVPDVVEVESPAVTLSVGRTSDEVVASGTVYTR